MPLKTRRALIATDGTIYCNAGTVLEDDDPVAARNINAIVGSTEPVTEGFKLEPELRTRGDYERAGITIDPEPKDEEQTEQADDGFLSELADESEDGEKEEAEEEEDEGVDL